MVSSAVEINGILLREDRENALLSREALVEATQGHVSVETLRRAETGKRIQHAKLKFIANALGQDPDRYRTEFGNTEGANAPKRDSFDLTGNWIGYWVESYRVGAPYVVQENTRISHVGNLVRAEFNTNVDGLERQEKTLYARLDRRTLSCVTSVDGWIQPNGTGLFQVQIGRNDNWMEGYTIWDDADTGQIEASRYVCIRVGDPEFESLEKRAKQLMDAAMEAYAWRRRFWSS